MSKFINEIEREMSKVYDTRNNKFKPGVKYDDVVRWIDLSGLGVNLVDSSDITQLVVFLVGVEHIPESIFNELVDLEGSINIDRLTEFLVESGNVYDIRDDYVFSSTLVQNLYRPTSSTKYVRVKEYRISFRQHELSFFLKFEGTTHPYNGMQL